MPGWDITENEIRYRIRDPGLYIQGSFVTKEFQENPRIYTIMGKLKGEDTLSVQSLRFSKKDWGLKDAKKWYEEHKDTIQKSDIVEKSINIDRQLSFFQKANLEKQSIAFSMRYYSAKAVEDFCAAKNYDITQIKKEKGRWTVEIQSKDNFVPGSMRDVVLKPGLSVKIGMLKKELQKAIIEKRVPKEFSMDIEDMRVLEDLNITEVTLTESPVLGSMAEFRIIKSNDTSVPNFNMSVPILKVNEEERIVKAYALVPFLPDFQNHFLTKEEVRKAAHSYMRNLAMREQQGSGTGYEHKVFENVGYPVEHYIDYDGKNGVKGGWWLETKVVDDHAWEGVQSGRIVGYSVGGYGHIKKATEQILKSGNMEIDEEITENIATKILKKLGLLKDKPAESVQPEEPEKAVVPEQTEDDADISKSTEVEDKKTMVDIDFLTKYDLKPSEVQSLENAGVDVQKAFERGEEMLKAMGFNFSTQGIGHTTKQIIQAVRDNTIYGQFPTPGSFTSGGSGGMETMAKSLDPKIEQKTEQPSQTEEPKQDDEIKKSLNNMVATMQQLVENQKNIAGRLDTVENARGIRKSTQVANVVPPAEDPIDDGYAWDGTKELHYAPQAIAKNFPGYNS